MTHDAVLAALVGSPAHGYAVARRMGAGEAEGTLYPVLHRLERDGLVRSGWAEVEGRRRRVYELTAPGVTAAAAAVTAARRGGARSPRLSGAWAS